MKERRSFKSMVARLSMHFSPKRRLEESWDALREALQSESECAYVIVADVLEQMSAKIRCLRSASSIVARLSSGALDLTFSQ